MAIAMTDVKRVILQEDDFGHELRVGSIFEKIQFEMGGMEEAWISSPEHGGTYVDRVSGKTRQFDYRCSISRINRRTPHAKRSIHLAVECKNLNPDFPLVVCGRPRTSEESFHLVLHQPQMHILNIRPIKFEESTSIYKPDAFVGKNIVRLKKKNGDLCSDGDNEIYDRWTQALSSCHDLCGTAFRAYNGNEIIESFVIPVVVLPNNSLWKANYKNDGTLADDPSPVDDCEFYINQEIRGIDGGAYRITHIHFTTLTGFEEMLKQFATPRTTMWKKIFGPQSE